jgi:pilus assembly protein CpaF
MFNIETVLIDKIKEMVRENEFISEFETNGYKTLFYKERGVRKSVPLPFKSEEEYNKAIDALIKDAGFIKKPYLVEGRYNLPNGKFGRLHIAMPPASPTPLITLAVKSVSLVNLTALQSTGSFNTEISKFLKAAIGAKLTIVVSGGTGAGKTTLLEAMTGEFTEEERIGVCEDSPELKLKTPNTAYLNSTVWVPGLSEKDVAPLSWIVKQINRMRVDRIIIGETRGEEFFDFITAANSGAEGSLTTIHANDAHAAMEKMATFMYMAIDMAPRIINKMIAGTVDIVIQLGRSKIDGSHKILSISEVTQAMSSGDAPTIALNPLFEYNHDKNIWTKKFATDSLKNKLVQYGYDPNNYTVKGETTASPGTGGFLPSYFKMDREEEE